MLALRSIAARLCGKDELSHLRNCERRAPLVLKNVLKRNNEKAHSVGSLNLESDVSRKMEEEKLDLCLKIRRTRQMLPCPLIFG